MQPQEMPTRKATLGGRKSRAHCDPSWRTQNDLNATKTGPAAWAFGYYLSQYFSKSEKEEERKKKKLCSIYEGNSIPSKVKLLYQGFQKLLSKNYMLETLVVKYCCLVLNIFFSFNLHKNSDIARQILILLFYR